MAVVEAISMHFLWVLFTIHRTIHYKERFSERHVPQNSIISIDGWWQPTNLSISSAFLTKLMRDTPYVCPLRISVLILFWCWIADELSLTPEQMSALLQMSIYWGVWKRRNISMTLFGHREMTSRVNSSRRHLTCLFTQLLWRVRGFYQVGDIYSYGQSSCDDDGPQSQ